MQHQKFNLTLIVTLLTFFLIPFLTPSTILAQEKSHIKYFGYYWGIEDISKISSYTNIAFVTNQYKASSAEVLAKKDIEKLNQLNDLKIKGVLNISNVFWDIKNGNTLRPDWKARWNNYWKIIHPHLSKVAAFYPMDEPDGNVSMRDYANVVQQIKINVNEKTPILMVITPSGTVKLKNKALSIPSEIDWLGFDEYQCWDTDCYKGLSIPDKFKIIIDNAKKVPGRKVVIVPDAKNPGPNIPSTQIQQQKVQAINKYYKMCKDEPLCVAVLPFLWKTTNPKKGPVGTDQMKIVENRLKQIGLEIKSIPTANITCSPTNIEVREKETGSATIKVNGLNLHSVPNPSNVAANLCVSRLNNPEKLMTTWISDKYNQEINPDWLVADETYTFKVYLSKKDSPCKGKVLDTCTVTTKKRENLTYLRSDLNNDKKIDKGDFNILIKGFDTKYDIFDYNLLVMDYL